MSDSILDSTNLDSTKLDSTKLDNSTDFVNVTSSVISSVNYKLVFCMFIIGMLIFSDMFIDGVLQKIPNSVDGLYTTNKGTTIQLMLYCLVLLVLDILIKKDII